MVTRRYRARQRALRAVALAIPAIVAVLVLAAWVRFS
jgi:hypothetical protein